MNEIQTARTAEDRINDTYLIAKSETGVVSRNIREVTEEILTIKRYANRVMLYSAVEIGKCLVEAKAMLPYGEWLPWLEEKVQFSKSSAARFMQVYREYGPLLLEGKTDFPSLGNLSFSNALRLLALPAEERADFAEEHDVEHLSARELDKLMAERDEAIKRAEKAEEAAGIARAEVGRATAEFENKLREAEQEAWAAREREKDGKTDLESAERRIAALTAENKELRERPVDVAVEVDQEAIDKAAAEAKAAADVEWGKKVKELMDESDRLDAEKEESRKMQEKEINELHEKLKAAKKAAEEADKRRTEGIAPYEEKIATLEKRLAMSGAEVTAFKLLFSDWQEAFNRMLEALQKVPEENRDKLSGAVKSVLEGQVSRA